MVLEEVTIAAEFYFQVVTTAAANPQFCTLLLESLAPPMQFSQDYEYCRGFFFRSKIICGTTSFSQVQEG